MEWHKLLTFRRNWTKDLPLSLPHPYEFGYVDSSLLRCSRISRKTEEEGVASPTEPLAVRGGAVG